MSGIKTHIITHRGLDPDRVPYFTESSEEAFADQLTRGYGLEFDVHFTKDNEMIVIHDSNLKRLTDGRDERKISEVDSSELITMDFHGNHLATIPDLLTMIEKSSAPDSISALHIKHMHQTPDRLDHILEALEHIDADKLLIFDVKIETAKYMRKKNPKLHLAPSVSHPHDIERYNSVVGGTLIGFDEVFQNNHLFDFVWLDEWDRSLPDGNKKTLYNAENFKLLREKGFKIALVNPELHGTSPGLLGGEAHPDARDRETLNRHIIEILQLEPDAVCTDHPDHVRLLLEK